MSRGVLIGVGALLAVLAAFALWQRGPSSRGGGSAALASIAVLPFADYSPDRTNAYLGDGIAETLIKALSNVPGLKVTPRTSAFAFRDRRSDLREIARQLGVTTVLDGSVQRAGDRLRITAQVVPIDGGEALMFSRWLLGDEATIRLLESMPDTSRVLPTSSTYVYVMLGPTLRVHPRVQAVGRRLGWPPVAGSGVAP